MDRTVHIRSLRGFTLLEIMITMTILGIVLAIGIPSMNGIMETKRLVTATEQIYEHVQQARLEAIARSSNFYVNFNADGSATWQYGFSATNNCDLSQATNTGASACVTIIDDGDGSVHGRNGVTDTGDLVLTRFTNADYQNVSMTLALAGGASQLTFDPLRGTSNGGDITLTSASGKNLKVKVGLLGQLRICSPDGSVPGYSTASC